MRCRSRVGCRRVGSRSRLCLTWRRCCGIRRKVAANRSALWMGGIIMPFADRYTSCVQRRFIAVGIRLWGWIVADIHTLWMKVAVTTYWCRNTSSSTTAAWCRRTTTRCANDTHFISIRAIPSHTEHLSIDRMTRGCGHTRARKIGQIGPDVSLHGATLSEASGLCLLMGDRLC